MEKVYRVTLALYRHESKCEDRQLVLFTRRLAKMPLYSGNWEGQQRMPASQLKKREEGKKQLANGDHQWSGTLFAHRHHQEERSDIFEL